jgi:two-component sensor histidine kinase
MGIRLRLLALVLLAALPLFLIELWIQIGDRDRRLQELGAEVLAAARLSAAEQARHIETARSILVTALRSPGVARRDAEICAAFLAELGERFPAYTGFGVASPNGTILCSSIEEFVGRSLAERDYFIEALEAEGLAIGRFQRGVATARPIVGVAVPLLDATDEVALVGVLGLDLWRFSESIALPELRPGAALVVFDEHGTVLARTPDWEQWIGEAAASELVAGAARHHSDVLVQSVGLDGVERLWAITSLIPNKGIRAAYGVPLTPLTAEANQAFFQRVLPMAAVFLIAASLAWIGGELGIRRPLRQLRSTFDRVGDGDLHARSGLNSGVKELRQLAAQFDAMAESVERHERELVGTNEQLRKALEQRDLLFQEMNHRIKNSLQLVSSVLALQMRDLEDQRLRWVLQATQARVLTVAQIHERLSAAGRIETVEFGDFLRELCADLASSLGLGESGTRLEVEAAAAELPADQALALAMIANELITNAIKHAPADLHDAPIEVRFALEANDDRRLEVVQRHAVRCAPIAPAADRGLGMRLVAGLTEQHHGRFDIERNGEGLRFRISMPASAKRS